VRSIDPEHALDFVRAHGLVLQAAKGSLPSLAEAIAGEPIRGSWWAHPKAHDIFRAAHRVCESDDVLVCKLVHGKITYVHRRLWPGLVKLSSRFSSSQLAKVWDEHTNTGGAHRSRQQAFPEWVPADVFDESRRLSQSEAERLIEQLLPFADSGSNRSQGVRESSQKVRRRKDQ